MIQFTGMEPAGTTRNGRRIKELRELARVNSASRGTGTQYRQSKGGTAVTAEEKKGRGTSGGLTWLA